VNLIKKQKEDAAKHKEFTNQKTREIHALKRKEKTAEKKISMIEAENQKFRFNLERSRAQNQKLSEKLKQTETHLMRLLTKRRNDLTRTNENRQSKVHDADFQQDFEGRDMFAPSNEAVNSLRFLLEKTVSDRVTLSQQLEAYETKVVEHGKLMQSMAKEVNFLNKRKRERQVTDPDSAEKVLSEIKDHEENVQEYQLKLELVENDLQKMRAKCPRIEEYYFDEDPKQKLMREKVPALKMIAKIEAPVLRTLLWEFLESHVKSEVSV
jgi:chromosome segregation ATPase